jgi:hypothetical protein
MAAFRAKRPDGRAEWRVVYDIVSEGKPDDQFSYALLGSALQTNDRHRVQDAVRRANRELWKRCNRSLVNIPKFGYRILRAVEHEDQATGYQRRSRKQMRSAVAVITATDLSALTDPQRNRTLAVAGVFVNMMRMVDYHSRKLAHHDQLIQDLESRITQLERVD